MKRFIFAACLGLSIAWIAVGTAGAADAKAKPKPKTDTPSSTITPAASGANKTPAVVDSLALLERAVARDSSKFDNLYKLGVLYLDRDRVPEAIRVLTRAKKLKPKHVGTLVNLGAAEDAAGRAENAQHFYREALAVSPDDSVATCRLASSLYAQSKYTEAMDLLRGLIASKPSAYCAYFTLGVAFADAGIYRDAIRMWKKVVDLAPNSPEAASAHESIDVLEKFIQQTP